MKIKVFDELATQLVGDGKRPNLYFISKIKNNVMTTFLITSDEYFLDLFIHKRGYYIEDRLTGELWDGSA